MNIIQKKIWKWFFLLTLLINANANAQVATKSEFTLPAISLKTNIFYDLTSTINLGVEFRTSDRTSLEVYGNWNPFDYSNNRKWKHVLIQPEFRLWRKQIYFGHFFGLHAHYGFYNIGNLPGPFSDYMKAHRFQGWLVGAGLSYGYRWSFSKNWDMEATVGAGYAHMDYDKYDCKYCGAKLSSETKNYFGPTKAGITLIYTFVGKNKSTPIHSQQQITVVAVEPAPFIPKEIEVAPEPVYIPPLKSTIEILVEKYPFVLPASEYNPAEPIRFNCEERDNALTVYYRLNSNEIDEQFADNALTLASLLDVVGRIQHSREAEVSQIIIAGFSSPDGFFSQNKQLAGERAESVRDYLLANAEVKKETILLYNGGADWLGLRRLIAEDNDVPSQSEALEIIDNCPIWDSQTQKGRQNILRELNAGKTWNYIKTYHFPKLRNGTFIRVYWSPLHTYKPD